MRKHGYYSWFNDFIIFIEATSLWCYDNDPSHDLTDLMDNQKPWCGYQDPAIADANGCYSVCRSGSSRACIKTTRESSVIVNKQKTNDINKGCALDLHQYKKHIGADRCSSDPKEICGIVSGPINRTIDVMGSIDEYQQQCLKKLKDGKFIEICFCSSDYCNTGSILKNSLLTIILVSMSMKFLFAWFMLSKDEM